MKRGTGILGDYYALPQNVTFRKAPTSPRDVPEYHVSREKRKAARIAYVTGEVTSVKGASKAVSCRYTDLADIAKHEDWRTERDLHEVTVREKTLEESAAREAKAVSSARTTAWDAAVKAVEIVESRLNSGDYVPSAMDASRLVSMAIELTGASDVGADHEKSRLRSKTIAEIGQDLVKTLKDQYGEDVIDVEAVVRPNQDESI